MASAGLKSKYIRISSTKRYLVRIAKCRMSPRGNYLIDPNLGSSHVSQTKIPTWTIIVPAIFSRHCQRVTQMISRPGGFNLRRFTGISFSTRTVRLFRLKNRRNRVFIIKWHVLRYFLSQIAEIFSTVTLLVMGYKSK